MFTLMLQAFLYPQKNNLTCIRLTPNYFYKLSKEKYIYLYMKEHIYIYILWPFLCHKDYT